MLRALFQPLEKHKKINKVRSWLALGSKKKNNEEKNKQDYPKCHENETDHCLTRCFVFQLL